ncbi:MAG: PspC domain-containing protein [Leptolinea sp.]|jgi:phage shock protein PspC (stress-responsive transcriptional regulator)|nr:PspC domain-containing protein [Leptolinea sp.]
MQNRLVRPENGRVLAGVCAGLANWIGIDVTLIRIIFLLFGFMTGMGVLVYIILWVVIPSSSESPSAPVDWSSRAGQMRDDFIQATSQPNMDALKIFGGVLVALGSFYLIKEIRPEWFHWVNRGVLWAVALIVIGAVFVFRSIRGDR